MTASSVGLDRICIVGDEFKITSTRVVNVIKFMSNRH